MATLSELASLDSQDFNRRIEIALFEKADEVLANPSGYDSNDLTYAKNIYTGNYNLTIVANAVLTNATIQALDNPYNVSDTDLRFAVKTEQFPLLADANA